MSELNREFQRLAEDGARQARPVAPAEIIRLGDRHRQRSRTRQSLGGLSAAGVVGAGVALGLSMAGSASPNGPSTIKTAAFTLVSNVNGTTTLTVNAKVVFEPATLQRDLEQDGIPAMVTVGSFCSSDPAPAGAAAVLSIPKLPNSPLGGPPQRLAGRKSGDLPERVITINPAAMPAGTELSFGNFRVANGADTFFTLVDKQSYTCTSTVPATAPANGGEFSFSRGSSSSSSSSASGSGSTSGSTSGSSSSGSSSSRSSSSGSSSSRSSSSGSSGSSAG